MDRWPTHQPNAGWQMIVVLIQIPERSGRPDLTALARDLGVTREKFFGGQEKSDPSDGNTCGYKGYVSER